MSVSSQWWAKGRNQEQMLISSPWISHSPGQASQMREQQTHILTLHLPLSCLSCSLLSFRSPASHSVGCHLSTQPTHPPTVGAACIIWVNLCSLAPPSFWHPDVFTWAWLLQVEGEFSCPAYELCHRRSLCCVAPAVPFLTLHWARFIWNYQGCFFHFSVNTTLLTLALSTLQAGCTQASSALKVSHQC